ncbi:unnamed protein product [Mortierella alpina]
MSIAAYLQTELVALSNEARRKHPEIKEAAERVIALLRHPGQGPGPISPTCLARIRMFSSRFSSHATLKT